jgi:hypothetical protein
MYSDVWHSVDELLENKGIHISRARTRSPRTMGVLLPLSNSYGTHVNLLQQVLEVPVLYCLDMMLPFLSEILPR